MKTSFKFLVFLVVPAFISMTFINPANADTPDACPSVSLSEVYKYVGAPESNWTVAVTTPTADCTWTASSDSAWLVVKSTTPSSAVGSGSVQLRSLDNMGPAHTGHFTIGGVVYTVDQEAGPFCPSGRNALIVSGARGSGASFLTTADKTHTTVTFQLAPGCMDKAVNLLSWQKQSTTDKYPQTILATASGVFSGDGIDHTLTINLQPCQMQADLVFGTFAATTLTAGNDATLAPQVADWIFDDTACAPPTPKATIAVTKVVINDNAGTSVAKDFPLMVGTTSVASGVAEQIDPGTYKITESGPTAGYVGTFSGDCDASGNIVLAANDNKSCTLTNNDIAPASVSTSSGGVGGNSIFTAPPPITPTPTPTPTPVPTPPPGVVLGISTPEETPLDMGGGEVVGADTTPVGGVDAGHPPVVNLSLLGEVLMLLGLILVLPIKSESRKV